MKDTVVSMNAPAIVCLDTAARMERLERFGILDTERDIIFDGIADLAAALFDAPVALINFIADGRQFFKAEIGIGARELPLESSICAHAFPEGDVFVVPDLADDDRFFSNPIVAVQDGMRFYAGYVLKADGVPIGAVCVLDRKPRPEGITEPQRVGLRALGIQTMFALTKSAEARRDRFLLTLIKQMQDAAGPVDMMEAASKLLGEYLGVSQIGFAEVENDQEHLRVERDWNEGRMASVVGRWRINDFGPESIAAMKVGLTIVIDDVHDDTRSNGSLAAASYSAIGARSVIVVPLVRGGSLVATLFVHHAEPRVWHRDDIALVEDTATQLWGAVLRARADGDIATRSREIEALIGMAPIGFAYFDREHRYLRINDELAAINGLPAAEHIGACFDDLMPINAATVSPIIDQVFATGEVAKTIEVTGDTPLLPGVMRHWLTSWFPVVGDRGEIVSVGAWVVEITERRRAEDAQRASEQRLTQAQDLGGIGSWEWDHSIGLGQVSASYRALHELPEDGPLTDSELFAIMHVDDHAAIRASVEKGIASGERIVSEYRVVSPKTGDVRWLRGTGQRVGPTGTQITAGIVEDITQRRASNALIQSQADEIAAIFDAAPVGLAVFDRELRYRRINEQLAKTSGVSAADHIGKTPSDLTPDLGDQAFAMLKNVLAGELVIGAELVGETPTQPGVVRTWRENWVPMRNDTNDIVGIVVSSNDITKEKEAADQLRNAVERAEIAQSAAGAALYEFDPILGLGTPSHNLKAITGYQHGATISLEWWQSLVHPDDLGKFARTIQAAAQDGGSYAVEYRLRHHDGRWVWVADRGRAVPVGETATYRLIGMLVDIDQQRSTQEALAESEARYRGVFEQAGVGVARVSLQGPILQVNDRYCTILGRSREDLITGDWRKITHPDDVPKDVANIVLLLAGGASDYTMEKRYIAEDGSDIWVNLTVSLVRDASGEPAFFVAVAEDIAARKQAELALFASEARLRAVINSAPVGLVFADAKGKITGGNARIEEIIGHSVLPSPNVDAYGEWVGFHSNGRQVEAREYPLARVVTEEADRAELEVLYQRGDGRNAWVRFVAAAIRDANGALIGGVVASLDIDREKRLTDQLELEVEAAVAERDRLWDTAEDLLMLSRLDGSITAINPAWSVTLGWTSADLIGTNFWKLSHPDDVAMCGTNAGTLSSGEKMNARFETRSRAKNGNWHWLAWSVSSAGGILSGVARDVTEDKRRQSELEAAKAQLHEAQKIETIGQLTGGVAHDFNNLLTPIMGVLEMMERRVAGEERTIRLVSGALQSAERAKNLIQRLLAFARRQHLETKAVDLETLIEGMRDLIDRSIGPTIAVEVVLSPALCAVKVDPNQLELALLNLAVNARDAMSAGGVLRFEARHEDVGPGSVHELAPGSFVCLTVSDTGTGMDPETLQRCIEPFYTSKGVGEGTGLGLSMVHGMMRQLGGALVITSKPGQGTTMALWLPCSLENAGENVVGRASLTPAPRRSTILLVDDEELVRESTADMLNRLGYDVVQAKDGSQALERLGERTTIDALVTDYLMPGMTGRELAERARRERPGLPVLLITGYTRLDELGPDLARLEKPFRQAEFAARVADLVGTT